MTYPDTLIDKRTVQRYLENGKVDRTKFQDYLQSLPDTAQNMEVMECIQDPEASEEISSEGE
ncbi:MAG: hypothetical protein IPJ88_05270 [Myxococcales bacterium]|nr:MAG: hypothetical protein IPJ88_05270 [Myxococcales bacterium]